MLTTIHNFKLWLNEWLLWPIITGLVIGMFLNGYINKEQDYILENMSINYDLHLATSSVVAKRINQKLDLVISNQYQQLNTYRELNQLQKEYIDLLEKEVKK